jgi:hypothetical protein
MPNGKGSVLSVGGKSYVMEQAKAYVYGIRKEINTKELQKGLIVENDAIKLLNEVRFTNYVKNTEHRENDWLTGTPDIVSAPQIDDVKSSFSLNTFPVVPEDGEDKLYEWQMRAYMWLFDKPQANVNYCLVDTPEELIGFDSPVIHRVSHIPAELRVTTVNYKRNVLLEETIKQKVEAAQIYFDEAVESIIAAH